MKEFFSEHKMIHAAVCLLFLIGGLSLVIIGQKQVGISGIAVMLAGLGLLLALLGYYNHYYR